MKHLIFCKIKISRSNKSNEKVNCIPKLRCFCLTFEVQFIYLLQNVIKHLFEGAPFLQFHKIMVKWLNIKFGEKYEVQAYRI